MKETILQERKQAANTKYTQAGSLHHRGPVLKQDKSNLNLTKEGSRIKAGTKAKKEKNTGFKPEL